MFLILLLILSVEGKALNSQQIFSYQNSIDQCNVLPPKPREEYPYFVSAPVEKLHGKLFRDIFQIILNSSLFFNEEVQENEGREPPLRFKSKQELREMLDFTLPKERASHEELVEIVKQVIKFSPHPSHPYKLDRHGTGLDPYGLVADWLGTTLSAPTLNYYLAPVFTLMEFEVGRAVREVVYGHSSGDSVIPPGANMGNGYAIQSALQQKFPDFKMRGFQSQGKLAAAVFFVSEHADFSYERHATWQGIGLNGIVRVKTDSHGRMDVSDLELKIREALIRGQTPFMVIGTAGTPILGAIDPLEEIATVAKINGLWFHVDGQLAGSLIFSSNLRRKIRGAELSDSYLWSPDKSLSLPFVSSVLVTREAGIFDTTFALNAEVVFHYSPLYDSKKWDNGDFTLQTTRRPDVIKIWFVWKAKGPFMFAQHVEHTYRIAQFAVEEIRKRSAAFHFIISGIDSNQIAFYYLPKVLHAFPRNIQLRVLNDFVFTERLKAVLLKNGILTISVNKLPLRDPNNLGKDEFEFPFFVMCFGNSALTEESVIYIFQQIEAYGEALARYLEKDIKTAAELQSATENVNGTELSKSYANRNVKVNAKDVSIPDELLPSAKIIPPISFPKSSSAPEYISAPIKSLHKSFIERYFDLILDQGTYFEEKRNEPPLIFKTPAELLSAFDFSLKKSVGTMTEQGDELLEIIGGIINYSGHYGHPYYNFQLAPGFDPYTTLADYVMATINSPMTTYEDSPMFSLMEPVYIQSLRDKIGYVDKDSSAGLILPGGSAGNQFAFHLAYTMNQPKAMEDGVSSTKDVLVAFLSAGAHYCTEKAAIFGGLGKDNIIRVNQDDRGRMCVFDLRKKIQQAIKSGKKPFYVTATAGTTVLGAFDPIDQIADICEEYGMWLHIDGSYGGNLIMTLNYTKRIELFKGVERSDSFTVNQHKVFGAVRESSLTVVRKKGILKNIVPRSLNKEQEFGSSVLYKGGEENDPGFLQQYTERRANIFKMWFQRKAKGSDGLGAHIDHGFNLTRHVYSYLQTQSDRFILANPVFHPDAPNVNFYYVPKSYRNKTNGHSSRDFWINLEGITLTIAERVTRSNRIAIAFETVAGLPSYLILSLYNSALTFEDAKYMIDVIDFYGRDL